MTPVAGGRPTGRARDWTDFDRPSAPRRAVAGGVKVPRSWKPQGEEAARLEVVSEGRTTPGIGSRGRTYARAGQVVEVRVGDRGATAAIQGSDDAPYTVSLTRQPEGDVEATCTCPYGCDAVEWCKHAAALAFVVAHLVDTDAGLAAAWSGTPAAAVTGAATATTHASGAPVRPAPAPSAPAASVLPAAGRAALVAALRPAPAPVDARAQWRAALEVVPLP
ncbi:SWIM zinc finger domain-containing protein [Kineosporia sp. A_224]|uniref:SWIM zinc finger family protein n=1 Tax=Kineosporia sp. A_224 TaxID=1962180 RepID=UPI000B4AAB55|nr:hypothetical protein [Kineosporia sp. A_224]